MNKSTITVTILEIISATLSVKLPHFRPPAYTEAEAEHQNHSDDFFYHVVPCGAQKHQSVPLLIQAW